MINLLQAVLSGLVAGALVALMALGIALIYRTTGVLNLSQGGLAAVAAYVCYSMAVHMPLVLAMAAATLAAALLGALISIAIGDRLSHGSPVIAVVATLALALALDQVTQQIWGATPAFFPNGLGGSAVRLGAIALSRAEVWGFGASVVLTSALYLLLRFTHVGLGIRAVADNAAAARLSGIPAPRLHALCWALGGGLAGVAGIFIAASSGILIPGFMEAYLMAALVASVIGGLSSLPGAAAGALVIGALESVVFTYAPTVTIGSTSVPLSSFTSTFLFLVLIITLVLAPAGLMGGDRVRRI